MNHNKAILLILIPLALLAAGCTQDCQTADYAGFEMFQDDPADGAIIDDLTPHFGWHHNQSCQPKYTRLMITRKSMEGYNRYYRNGVYTGWTLPGQYTLEPGGEYYWNVTAYESVDVQGVQSPDRVLYTGPMCSGQNLLPPVIKSPEDGAWVDLYHENTFSWYYPGECLPPDYAYQFAMDPNFSQTYTSGFVGNHQQHVDLNTPNCTTMYWRVAAKVGNSIGPYSEPKSFTKVATGDCWQIFLPSPTMALLKGNIYLDSCSHTSLIFPLNNYTPPPGCLDTPGIGVHANGIREQGEKTVENLIIDLGSGPCPSTGLDQMNIPHMSQGYKFIVQLPGTYCLTVSKDQTALSGFDPVDLNDGLWTEPLTKNILAQQTVSLQEGFNVYEVNFGWDQYDFMFKIFEVEVTSNCRSGPGIDYPILANPEGGTEIPIIARNQDSTWFVAIVDGVECLISTASGEPPDGVEELEIFDPFPPPPTKVPVVDADKPEKDPCEKYDNRSDCSSAGCYWDQTNQTCRSH